MNINFEKTLYNQLMSLAKDNNLSIATTIHILLKELMDEEVKLSIPRWKEEGFDRVEWYPDELLLAVRSGEEIN